jgi:hypothetical protein
MSAARYPDIRDFTLAVILCADPGAEITRRTVDEALTKSGSFSLTAETFDMVIEDLRRVQMIDEENTLTPLADSYARMWRAFLARQAAAKAKGGEP